MVYKGYIYMANWVIIYHLPPVFWEPGFQLLKYMDVSKNSGFSPQIIQYFNRDFHYKSSNNGGTPIFGNTHMVNLLFEHRLGPLVDQAPLQ